MLKNRAKPQLTGAQKIKALENQIELDEIARRAAFDREQEEHERNMWRANVAEVKMARKRQIKTENVRAFMNRAVPYVPLVLVNLAAITGQVGWALDHLTIGGSGTALRWFVALMFGSTAESIALFLQFYANRALRNRDSAGALYLGAFVVAGLVASVNFSHWSNPKPTEFFGTVNATAVVFALCSFASPWLWRIHSRAENREILKAAGEIDTRGVKLSLSRKIWHPVWSIQVISFSAWSGTTNPAEAVAEWEAHVAQKKAQKALKRTEKAVQPTPVLSTPRLKRISQKPSQAAGSDSFDGWSAEKIERYQRGVQIYRKSLEGPGRPLSQRDLSTEIYGKTGANRSLAIQIINDVQNGRVIGEVNNAVLPTP